MMKFYKRIIIITFLITLFTPNAINALSQTISIEGNTPSPNEVQNGGNGGTCNVAGYALMGTTSRTVYYKTKWKYQNEFYVYNKEDALLQVGEKVLSGTAIGISLYEENTIYWDCKHITTQTYGKQGECEKWHLKWTCLIEDSRGNCHKDGWVPTYCEKYATKTTSCTSVSGCSASEKRTAYNEIKKSIQQSASYKLEIEDPNDANETSYVSPSKVTEYIVNDGEVTNPIIKRFYYETSGACINRKTAKVRYLIDKEDKCKSDEEMLIANNTSSDKRHWHTFIPLNQKSNDDYIIKLSPAKDTITQAEECKAIINKYESNYYEIIAPLKGTFTKNKNADLAKVDQGCKKTSVFSIPVIQKFYNEEQKTDKDINFKGFAFYYRPINITNPFPNGVATDSLWKLQEKEENYGIEWGNKTYYTNGINIETIRSYNNEHSYTDWSNINIKGYSGFLKNTGVIRTDYSKGYYQLGCGPYNRDWEECK